VCTTHIRRSAARTASREHSPFSSRTLARPEGAGACEHLDEEALRRCWLDLGHLEQQKRRRDEGEEPLTSRESVRHTLSVSGYRRLGLNGRHSRVARSHTKHLSTSLDITARAFARISHFVGYGFCNRHATEFSRTIYQTVYSAAHH